MAYPTLPIDNGSRRRPINLSTINITASGGVRQRNFQITELFEFNVVHSLLTKTEADSVYEDWQANKKAEIYFVWVDGVTYAVRYKEPPLLTHQAGHWWTVESKLVGRVL
jgi:hypothetical protein